MFFPSSSASCGVTVLLLLINPLIPYLSLAKFCGAKFEKEEYKWIYTSVGAGVVVFHTSCHCWLDVSVDDDDDDPPHGGGGVVGGQHG